MVISEEKVFLRLPKDAPATYLLNVGSGLKVLPDPRLRTIGEAIIRTLTGSKSSEFRRKTWLGLSLCVKRR